MAAERGGPLEAMNAIIREEDAAARIDADFAGFLRARGIEGADLEAMLAVGAKRFGVYRKLVHNRLRNTTREFVERTHARLGRDRFVADFDRYMAQRAPVSPYLRDVPREFIEWVAPRWLGDDQVDDYLVDLARHELLEYDVRNDPRGGEPSTGRPLSLDERLAFDGAARLMTYDHAVHRLSADEDDRTVPDRVLTRLLVYRDAEHRVRYLELTPFAAEVAQALMVEARPVADGLRTACARLSVALNDERLATAAQFLADLAERAVMLGALP